MHCLNNLSKALTPHYDLEQMTIIKKGKKKDLILGPSCELRALAVKIKCVILATEIYEVFLCLS